MQKCIKCGKSITPIPSGMGRPPRYCGVPCRRLAEAEIVRLKRVIEGLESERLRDQFETGVDLADGLGRRRAHRLRDTQAAIAAAEARLLDLFITEEGGAHA